MDVDKQIEQIELLAVKMLTASFDAAYNGNHVGAFHRDQDRKAYLAFIKLLQTPSTPTGNYTRFGTGVPEQMIAIGPHEAVQKAYYDRNYSAKKISSAARNHTDDREELPPSEAG